MTDTIKICLSFSRFIATIPLFTIIAAVAQPWIAFLNTLLFLLLKETRSTSPKNTSNPQIDPLIINLM